MIHNYLTIAVRSFLKHKLFTLLNILGLSLGMVASLLILQYVKYERSYDSFHPNADDIYRLQYNQWQNGKIRFECAAAVPAAGPALKNNFPEVKAFARLFPVSGIAAYNSPSRGVISFREEKMQIADPSVLQVLNIELLKGEHTEALHGPNKAVISQRAARKYFQDEDPVGKTITWDGNRQFEIRGVFENIPDNSHIKFDLLFSYATLNQETKNESETNWGWYDFNTYVVLQPGTDVKALQAKWDKWLEQDRAEEWEKYGGKQEFILQPIKDIHLYANLLQESQPDERGNGNSVYALSLIAFFILIIAWVNYINLATAKSFERANEVGVRKVMGAQQSQLIRQFFTEALLVNLAAIAFSLIIVRALWQPFSTLAGRTIPVGYMQQPDFWLLALAIFLFGTLLSGAYPALVLSSFKPVDTLKGKVTRGSSGNLLRQGLVVFQFAASVLLMIGSTVVYQQLQYMHNQKLGIDIHETLVFKGPGVVVDSLFEQSIAAFKTEALRISGIKSMSASSNVPGDEIFWASGIRRLNGGQDTGISGYTVGIDHDYVPAFNLTLAAGRNFDLDHPGERKNVILNRAMTEALNFATVEEAIGEKVSHGGDTLEIVGVLENYHQMSLKEKVSPLVYRYTPHFARFFAFKLESADHNRILAALEEPWEKVFPDNPIDYFYLDQFFDRQYDGERRFGNIFSLFTLLAIFVACLGLFGLASFMTMQRTKEIGIRKALGSTPAQVVVLLSKGFIHLVLIANLVAWPLAWFIMDRWLESFPYRVSINPVLFALAGAAVTIIAFASVGFQTLRAAQLSPAVTLKHE